MKKQYQFFLYIGIATLIAVASGCSKSGSDDLLSRGSEVQLQVRGISIASDFEAVAKTQLRTGAIQSLYASSDTISSQDVQVEGVEARIHVVRESEPSAPVGLKSGGAGVRSQTATQVLSGVKYRLILFDEQGDFISSTAMAVGEDSGVDVERGKRYHCRCLMFGRGC